jgi:glycosyltransferase involved in cell wall biosynthesis
MKSCPVSVIIPTYNRSHLLRRAVLSVLSQTVQCSELIIVDDGSTDETQALLNELSRSAKLPFRVYYQQNRGPAAARNVGVRKATFPFIAFLDSDDHWHKQKIEIQYKCLVGNSDFQISHTREKWLRRGLHLNQKKKHIPQHGNIFNHCLQLCGVGMSTVMMEKSLFDQVGTFDDSLQCCEDYDLWLRISCRFPFLLVDNPLTVKEGGREDQVSFQYSLGMDRLRIYSLRKMLDSDILDRHQHFITLKEFKKKITIFGMGCLKHNKNEIGQYYLGLISIYEEKGMKKFPKMIEVQTR